MAERMQYDVPPTRTEPTASEAMSTLMENLHQHGFLRLANDLVCANADIAKVLVDGLNKPGSQTAIQNLSLLMMALSRVPPERFNQLLMAVTDGANALSKRADDHERQGAPGIRGIIRILRDDELWHGIAPLLTGLRAFSAAMENPPEKPITRYSGKERAMPDGELMLLLSRWQFAVTIGLHIVLAAFALGLAQFLAFLEGMWLWRKDRRYRDAYRFWLKIFALTIAVGTVSGVVMEFQFATNWSELVRKTGAIIGPLMLYEVLVAFFMESALAGVMIFGLDRIRPGVHFLVTLMVALGALISAFWILAANSWMQTPTGFTLDGAGVFQPESWLTILRAPSFPWRLAHMVLAALLATAFLVAGVGAWRLLKGVQPETARLMVSLAMWLALILMPLQIIIGDLHGENTLEHQPQKVAAMEGNWHPPSPGEGEPLRLFAIPDAAAQRNHVEVAIPNVASLYLRHNLHGHIQSLSEFPQADLPPVALVFFAFRAMVGLGVLMLAFSLAALVMRLRKRLYSARWLLKSLVALSPAGFAAMLAGWVVTEVGRQPWTVWGNLRTAQSVSPLPSSWVIASLTAAAIIYAVAFAAGLRYFLRYAASPLPPENAQEQEKDDV